MEVYGHNDEFDSYYEAMATEGAIIKYAYDDYPATYFDWGNEEGYEYIRNVLIVG